MCWSFLKNVILLNNARNMEHIKPLNVQHNRYTRRLSKNKLYWCCHPL